MTSSVDEPHDPDAREYQWTVGYEEDDEFDTNPDWTTAVGVMETTTFQNDGTEVVRKTFYLKDNQNAWIESDVVLNLANTL